MRLLNTSTIKVIQFNDYDIPQKYAIFSHTWGEDEVTFQDIEDVERTGAARKEGYKKVENCCALAKADDYEYVWIDTACVDKTSSTELSEAMNSMYRWYEEAAVCYAYLADVPSDIDKTISDYMHSKSSSIKWFSRGWTLQELIAPADVIFLNQEWQKIGAKSSLQQDISKVTGIPVGLLLGDNDLEDFSIAQRMSWAAKRETSRVEDRAYCLMGIFGVNMPVIYGEREAAFIRLQEEIMRISDDHSLFAWRSLNSHGGLLATSPAAFIDSGEIVQYNPSDTFSSPLTMSSRGIHLELRFIGISPVGVGLAILHCKERWSKDSLIAIYLRDLYLTMQYFERLRSEEIKQIDLRDFKPAQYPMRRICIRQGRPTRTRKSRMLRKRDSIAPDKISPDPTITNLTNSEIHTVLLHAAKRGQEGVVWLLLTRSDVKVDLKDENGRVPLWYAVKEGHEAVVKLLLAQSNNGADLKDNYGYTPLSWAAQLGHVAIVRLLLESGKVDADSKDKNFGTPLVYAAEKGHEAVVQLLVNNGANIKTRERYGQTPLSWAAKNGQEAVVSLLLDKGADVGTKDNHGNTPLSWAAQNGQEAVVSLLVGKGADVGTKDNHGNTPLSWAAKNGHKAVVSWLFDKGADIRTRDNHGNTPLLGAAQNGQEAVVSWLFDKGANVESKNGDGRTALSLAAERGHEATVKLLLSKGANIETRDNKYARIPLAWAAVNGHEAIVKLLLDKGASIETGDGKYRRTLLSWTTSNRHKAVVKLIRGHR